MRSNKNFVSHNEILPKVKSKNFTSFAQRKKTISMIEVELNNQLYNSRIDAMKSIQANQIAAEEIQKEIELEKLKKLSECHSKISHRNKLIKGMPIIRVQDAKPKKKILGQKQTTDTDKILGGLAMYIISKLKIDQNQVKFKLPNRISEGKNLRPGKF